ncbi:MAG: hypothetical protein KGJ60_04970 [Verrucomicrobiota bacterium]|nr:hypothetical protein [Verrucomicrobiota bacterium]
MKTTMLIPFTAGALVLAVGLAATRADDADASPNTAQLPPPSTRRGVTYAADIKTIFDHSCVKCHSGRKPKGHLKLDTLADALKGGKDGKVILPGDSAKSMLILNVAHLSKDHMDWMPPLHNKAGIKPLTPEQISLLRAWIDQGAK